MSPKSLEVQIKHLEINAPIPVRQLAQSGLSKYVHVVVVEEVRSRNKALRPRIPEYGQISHGHFPKE